MKYSTGFIVAWVSVRRSWMVQSHSLMPASTQKEIFTQ